MVRRSAARRLTARDRSILHWVGQGGVAGLGQVARRFWPNGQVETAMDRLRQLVKAGYMEMHVCDALTLHERVFTLTKLGAVQLGPELRGHLYIGLPPVEELKQQLLAQEAYMKLEARAREQGGQLVDWRSERQLRAEVLRTHWKLKQRGEALFPMDIPDAKAVMMFPHGKREILYIEIDGAYYGKMLCHKAGSLAETGQKIVWVCTPARARYVAEAVAGYPNIEILCI